MDSRANQIDSQTQDTGSDQNNLKWIWLRARVLHGFEWILPWKTSQDWSPTWLEDP